MQRGGDEEGARAHDHQHHHQHDDCHRPSVHHAITARCEHESACTTHGRARRRVGQESSVRCRQPNTRSLSEFEPMGGYTSTG